MAMLTRDVQWTIELGNAFLAQQADVMNAIQQLRASARANGRLTDTPQQRVAVDQQNGQSAIVIEPTDPQVVYPPVYNPAYVWGPPVYGVYPRLAYQAPGYGITYAVGTFLGVLFSGLLSFGGWGWGLSWLTHGLFLNSLFFSHSGFHGFGGPGYYAGRGYASHVAWAHDPVHRLGVPYGNRSVAARYAGHGGSANYAGRSFNTGHAGYFGSSYAGSSRQMEAYRGLSAGGSRAAEGSRGDSYHGYGSAYRAVPVTTPTKHRAAPTETATRGATRQAAVGPHRLSAPPNHTLPCKSFSSSHYSAPKHPDARAAEDTRAVIATRAAADIRTVALIASRDAAERSTQVT